MEEKLIIKFASHLQEIGKIISWIGKRIEKDDRIGLVVDFHPSDLEKYTDYLKKVSFAWHKYLEGEYEIALEILEKIKI